jgi:hypothetical protein
MTRDELDALPTWTWIAVTNSLGTFHLIKVGDNAWDLTGDVTISVDDILDGKPSSITLFRDAGTECCDPFGDDPHWKEDEVCPQCESGLEAAESWDVMEADENA